MSQTLTQSPPKRKRGDDAALDQETPYAIPHAAEALISSAAVIRAMGFLVENRGTIDAVRASVDNFLALFPAPSDDVVAETPLPDDEEDKEDAAMDAPSGLTRAASRAVPQTEECECSQEY